MQNLPIDDDIELCTQWLREQLRDADEFLNEVDEQSTRGVIVWLDPQALDDGESWCVEIGASSECDPSIDSMDWVETCPWTGDLYLPEGLRLGQRLWTKVAERNKRDATEYVCFLFYTALLLAHAAERLDRQGPWLLAWGFQDGDQGLLWRHSPAGGQRLMMLAGEAI